MKGNGGWGEIRTHGEVAPTPVFKTGALNRSATHPHAVMDTRLSAAVKDSLKGRYSLYFRACASAVTFQRIMPI